MPDNAPDKKAPKSAPAKPQKGSVRPENGLWVLHLFCHTQEEVQPSKVENACSQFLDENSQKDKEKKGEKTAEKEDTHDNQLISVSILGHKADMAFMALSPDALAIRDFQSRISNSGLKITSSYLSLTEISEYAAGLPEEMKQTRLYPKLPPEEKPVWGFYPMSKRRGEIHNWFTLDYETRKALMHEHGSSGRKFSGRVVQLITGSTGIDDYEWGVTLFCNTPDSLKEVVYTMRFDEASAKYAEFGPFYTGIVSPVSHILSAL